MRLHYRPLRLFGTLGLAVLVLSTAGAFFAMNPTGAKGQRPGDTSAAPAPRAVGSLVSYGTYDAEPGVMPLYPTQPGRVVSVPVEENQVVKKGTVLIQLDDRLAKHRRELAKADLDAAAADLALAKKLPEQYQEKTKQQQSAVEAMNRDLNSAKLVHTRKKELLELKQPLINAQEVAVAEELVKKAEAGLRAEEAKLRELKLFDPQIQISKAEAQLAAKQAQLDQAELALDETKI